MIRWTSVLFFEVAVLSIEIQIKHHVCRVSFGWYVMGVVITFPYIPNISTHTHHVLFIIGLRSFDEFKRCLNCWKYIISITSPEGAVCHCAGNVAPQVRGKLQHLSPLTSPLILTKCTERFRGMLICPMCISSPYLPFNTMTVICSKYENKSRPNRRHPVSTEADIKAPYLCLWRQCDSVQILCENSWHISEWIIPTFLPWIWLI